RERTVVRDLNLQIRRGEVVVLLGRSRAGKSTLLYLRSGIHLPTAGAVHGDGRARTALPEHDRTLFRRRHVGFICQFFNLVPTLTVEENLVLPLELSGGYDAAQRHRALELLEQVGLADRARSFPDRLSGGEQHRVAVARALVHRPALLL